MALALASERKEHSATSREPLARVISTVECGESRWMLRPIRRMIVDGNRDELIDQWSAELDVLFPDPVDLFENGLAAELGLFRHPDMPLNEWRRVRVRFIESFPDEEIEPHCQRVEEWISSKA